MITSNSTTSITATGVNSTANANIDKVAIRKALRRALLPSARVPQYQKTYWPKWVEDRLTTLAIYSFSDKNKYNPQHIQCLKLYSSGKDYDTIANIMSLKKQTVEVYILKALDWIIDNTPDKLLANIPIGHSMWRIGACPHCKGSLMWSDDDNSYWCATGCGRYFNERNQPISQLAQG